MEVGGDVGVVAPELPPEVGVVPPAGGVVEPPVEPELEPEPEPESGPGLEPEPEDVLAAIGEEVSSAGSLARVVVPETAPAPRRIWAALNPNTALLAMTAATPLELATAVADGEPSSFSSVSLVTCSDEPSGTPPSSP